MIDFLQHNEVIIPRPINSLIIRVMIRVNKLRPHLIMQGFKTVHKKLDRLTLSSSTLDTLEWRRCFKVTQPFSCRNGNSLLWILSKSYCLKKQYTRSNLKTNSFFRLLVLSELILKIDKKS